MTRISRLASLAASALVAGLPLAAAAAGDVSFNVGAVSDWRYRGLSQTRLEPALQGGVDYANSGFYAGLWSSTIKWIKDAGGDANVEIDLYGGYKGSVNQDIAFDVGVLTYNYPSPNLPVSPDTQEAYGQLSFGPLSAKLSYAFSNLFGIDDSKGSYYVEVNGSWDWQGVSLSPHIGYQDVAHHNDNPKLSYLDYGFTVSKEVTKGLVLSGSIIGTDVDDEANFTVQGKFLGKTSLIVGAKYSF